MPNIYDMADTWNDGATVFTAIKMNVTDTASNSSSRLLDLQVGGSTKAAIDKSGILRAERLECIIGATKFFDFTANVGLRMYQASVAVQFPGGSVFREESANQLAQRNGVNPQTFNIYNTYTDASNYERGILDWSSNVFRVGTERAGTGSIRDVYVLRGGSIAMHFKSGAIDVSGQSLQLLGGSCLTFGEMSPPPTPIANLARVYAEDNGSGKTRLMVVFGTGAAQQIAIEP